MAKKNLTDPPEITYAKFELRENLRLFFWLTFKLSMSLYKSNQCMSLQAEAKIFYENLNFKIAPIYDQIRNIYFWYFHTQLVFPGTAIRIKNANIFGSYC